ncbi:MAG: hypothetical protein [Circoviridae sp.]|nr:MAG: hypothetical protein [Circoviridae sp.]
MHHVDWFALTSQDKRCIQSQTTLVSPFKPVTTRALKRTTWSECEMQEVQVPASAPIKAIQLASVLNHIRQNNVSYLLAVLISHMLGLTEQVVSYGQGMC